MGFSPPDGWWGKPAIVWAGKPTLPSYSGGSENAAYHLNTAYISAISTRHVCNGVWFFCSIRTAQFPIQLSDQQH
jgi:hypothetical protein